MRGLENLITGISLRIRDNLDQAITDFTSAVILHKNTLLLFNLKEPLRHDASKWDSIVESIQLCNKLVDLSVPLSSGYPTSYNGRLIAAFPSLPSLVIYTGIPSYHWCPGRTLKIYPTSTMGPGVSRKSSSWSFACKLWWGRAVAAEVFGKRWGILAWIWPLSRWIKAKRKMRNSGLKLTPQQMQNSGRNLE